MNRQTEKRLIAGPSGDIEIAIDAPQDQAPIGVAVVCHPHPVQGGTMDNKVVQTVARAFVLCGWKAVRFNFRGVGQSAGGWDEGRGEIDDALAVIQDQRDLQLPFSIAGFSFGGYVASQAAMRLADALTPRHMVLVGPATQNFAVASVPAHTLVIHGDADEVVPLSATLAWARAQTLPVLVVPGVGHFFHGQLPLLRQIVVNHLRTPLDP